MARSFYNAKQPQTPQTYLLPNRSKINTSKKHKIKYSITGIILTISLIILPAIILSGCKNDEPVKKINLNIRQHIVLKEEPNAITYAYLPQYSHTISYTRHHPLIQYLRKKTGLNIKQVFPDTFEQHMKMVGQGKIDISFSNPFIYIKN